MGSPKAIGEKAEVTDADEAFGQHVQKEATQELGGDQRHLTLLAAVWTAASRQREPHEAVEVAALRVYDRPQPTTRNYDQLLGNYPGSEVIQ